MDDNDDLLLPANPAQSTYAIYRLHVGNFALTDINFELADTTRPEAIWIGVADFFRGRWVWQQYNVGMGSVDVSSLGNRSPGGFAYLAIMAHDNAFTRVKRVYIDIEVPSWNGYGIDPLTQPGQSYAMVRIGDHVTIAYETFSVGSYTLRFATHTPLIPTQESDWQYSDIQAGYLDPILDLDLESVAGNPGIAMLLANPTIGYTTVWYAYAGSETPADPSAWTWSSPGVGITGDGLDLAEINGKPAMVYEGKGGNNGHEVRYAYSSLAQPGATPDWTIADVGTSYTFSQDYSGMHVYPVLSGIGVLYYNPVTSHLRQGYTTNLASTGEGSFTFADVDAEPLRGQLSAGIEFDMTPSCFYTDPTSGELHYASARFVNPLTVDDYGDRHVVDADYIDQSLAVASLPTGMGLAYREMDGNTVRFAWHENNIPEEGRDWRIVQVDDRPSTGEISLSYLQDGRPCVLYHTLIPDLLQFRVMVP